MVPNTLDSVAEVVETGQTAERLGYGRVWVGESWGRDAVTLTATLAAATDRVGLGTSILPVYSRTPALMGQTAATLQEASDGRFRLGIGPSGPAVIERWHGVEFDRPLRRTREYVEILRAVVRGGVVDYDGDLFELSGFRLRSAPPEPVPVDVAAIGPKMVELAGRFADGWHPVLLTPAGVEDRLGDLRRGAALGERSIDDVRVTVGVVCCVLADGERARALARSHVAMYLGAMGTYYRDAVADQGYESVAHGVHDAWQDGDREAAIGLVGDELLDDIAVAGTPETVADRLARFDLDGVDAVNTHFPTGATRAEVNETMAALGPDA